MALTVQMATLSVEMFVAKKLNTENATGRVLKTTSSALLKFRLVLQEEKSVAKNIVSQLIPMINILQLTSNFAMESVYH